MPPFPLPPPSAHLRLLLAFCTGLLTAGSGRAAESAPVLLSKTGGGQPWSTVAELDAAARRGDAQACAQLGEMLLRGSDVPPDGPRALALLEQAARAGEAAAAFRLGMLLESGDSVAPDPARAVAYLRAAAVGGVAEAFRNVGVAYSTGRGVKRDYAEAYGWLLLAKKHATAGTVADELRAFLTQLRRPELIAAGEHRAPALERELAQTSVAKALPFPAPLVFTAPPADPAPAATADAPSGEPPIKLLAPSGRLLRWPSLTALRRAADQGTPDALAALGQVLLEGKLLPEDSALAAGLLERAAKAGSADAAHLLAELHTKGTKVNRDDALAFAYTLQAARGGVRASLFNLGALYANGRGTPTNYPEALAWLIVAKHYHLDTGQVTRIRDYLAQTQPAQIPLAEQRAAERIREIDARRD